MDYEKMIQFFKTVKSQHEYALRKGHINVSGHDPKSLVFAYDFVIEKLNQWKTEEKL